MSDQHTQDTATTRYVEVAVIGAGTAGQNAFKQASKATDNIVIINDGFWTTTCATVGCMPSKLLIAAAERAHHAQHSASFGIHAEPRIDGKQVMQRVQAERDRFAGFVQQQVDGWDDDKKINGRARFTESGLITVNDEYICAKHIIIATGSQPFIPDGWADTLGDRLLTSDSVFELSDLPNAMAVVGAGAIGLELAQAFARLGVAVTLFNRVAKVAALSDSKLNQHAIDCLSQELPMRLGSHIEDLQRIPVADEHTDSQVQIRYSDSDGNAQQLLCDYVLVATGRRANLDSLAVEHLGVQLDQDGQPLDLNSQTGQIGTLPVYVVGDANSQLPLLHVASDEGYAAGTTVRHLLEQSSNLITSSDASTNSHATNTHNNPSSHVPLRSPATKMSVVFSEPQIAQVGMSLSDIQQAGDDYVIGEVDFANQGRSRVMGVNCGLLRIYACKHSDKILGAGMVAPDAEYMAHILATAISNQLSVTELLAAPFYHPTILEGLRTALRDVQAQMHIEHQTAGCNEC